MKDILASNLLALRKAKGLTQDELAEVSGVPKSTYVRIELGNSWPEHANVCAIAATLGVTEGRLFADPDYVATPEEALRILEKALKESELTPEMKRIVGRLRRLESFQLEALERVLDGVIKTLPPDPSKKGK